MAIMQTAYRTFESHKHLAGKIVEGRREALTPVSHMVTNAQIEITIDGDGVFQRADAIKNEKTIIPATVESASRVGDNTKAHPLCDQLRYVAPYGGEKFDAYIGALTKWAESVYSHPKVRAVFKYIQSGTIVEDLAESGVVELENGLIKDPKCDKYFVRWRVNLASEDDSKSACWEDTGLFDCYAEYYKSSCVEKTRDFCMIAGDEDMVCNMHPKGVVPANYGAKLLSANDSSGFTYRGRFTKPEQAYSVGYTASQKAHNALRWIAANEGVMIGGRTFICWNPEGKPVPSDAIFADLPIEVNLDYEHYKKQLFETISGYKKTLLDTDDVVVAALDAATTGRLSVTYYNELKASDFLNRIENWYTTVCWASAFLGTVSPTIKRIATCAFGVERGQFIEADEKVLREHVQSLLQCVVGGSPVPEGIVRALAVRAGMPLAYSSRNREILRTTACAMIRKYRNDKLKREEWKLALDTENTDRSYLFGRLLAVAENVERSTFDREEKRDTNAVRMQSVFAQRPLYAWRIIDERLNPYFAKLSPGLRNHYKSIIGEITDKLPMDNPKELGKKLDDTYLLGYYHQRSALYRKNETKIEEAIGNEYIEE